MRLALALLLAACTGEGGLDPEPTPAPADDDDITWDDDDSAADDDDSTPADDDDSAADDDDSAAADDDDSGDDDDATEPLLLFVNEIVADNDGSALDDLGAPSDWFELHNAGPDPIDLTGLFVSDDWTQPMLHPLPTLVVPPSGFLVLWADGDPAATGAHVPFGLASGGEAVGIFDPAGVAIDWVKFPPLGSDEAWIRLPDAGPDWSLSARGTPGEPNALVELQQVTLVAAASTWRFLDGGVAPDAAWLEPGFDDSLWGEGPAPLGYGDPVTTEVGYGGNPGNKHITTWFRHEFTVDAAVLNGDPQLTLALRVDDGGLVLLNGEELQRVRLPTGAITPSTLASQTASGATETTYATFDVPATALLAGPNALAVEVHQVGPSSSDISFDLSLEAEVWVQGP